MQGKVLFLELEGCDPGQIDSLSRLEDALGRVIEACGLTPLRTVSHKFEPRGASAMALIEESHVAMHSWPEHRYLSVLIYTCGEEDPRKAIPVIREAFEHTGMRERGLE